MAASPHARIPPRTTSPPPSALAAGLRSTSSDTPIQLGAAVLANDRQRVASRRAADHNPWDSALVGRVGQHPAGDEQHGRAQRTRHDHAEPADATELTCLAHRGLAQFSMHDPGRHP